MAAIEDVLSDDYISCEKVADYCSFFTKEYQLESASSLMQYVYDRTRNLLFPGNFPEVYSKEKDIARIFYCHILRTFFSIERINRPFLYSKHFEMVDKSCALEASVRDEYDSFLTTSSNLYLYEFFRISSQLTPFDTLGHVAGVHFVSMSMGKQLLAAGAPVDLCLLSGAAATHDIGKFGCRDTESNRVPYLHYYYTEQCTKRFGMPMIGHIAANHSTWDLELENLSSESLLLIYADFRVKSTKDASGRETVHIYTLKESFDVILSKLDHVDEAKKNRYRIVYAKLKDFEDYCIQLGVDTSLSSLTLKPVVSTPRSLMRPSQAVSELKFMAIEHNLYVMSRMNNESTLGNVLESARSEKDWKNLRAYINIFEEYCTYMTAKQKQLTLNFLIELLMHREGDIRRQSAALIGKVIANFDREYRKELPEDALLAKDSLTSYQLWDSLIHDIVLPDHKITDQHKRWMGYTLKRIMESLLRECFPDRKKTYISIFTHYFTSANWDEWAAFVLIDSSTVLPFSLCEPEQITEIIQCVLTLCRSGNDEVLVSSLRLCCNIAREPELLSPSLPLVRTLLDTISANHENVSIRYLLYQTEQACGFHTQDKEEMDHLFYDNEEITSELFLENLKIATPWIFKVVNINLLSDKVESGNRAQLLHIATHFANLVKVSERVTVRKRAGDALVTLIPHLPLDQRNEVAVELLRGLEIGDYQFSKYIPDYLGQIALYLHPNELNEAVYEFEKYMESTNDKIVTVTLRTLSVIISNYPSYAQRFPEDSHSYTTRYDKMIGLLSKGLANFHEAVSLEAFQVIGHEILGPSGLDLKEKFRIFRFLYKKIITLLVNQSNRELSFFNRAASLNHVYRFISQYLFEYGEMDIPQSPNVAFFPGTFDPFSLGHKGIATVIRDLGFEVYLALDEFSWSKKTQPKMIRRKIVSMSIADERDLYVFPDDIPVNIANPKDLAALTELFPGREVFIVTGSDVISNASAYKAPIMEHSIHTMNHIIFRRGQIPDLSVLTGKIRLLELSSELEDVSSTRIRSNIDFNRDISNLIDPCAQNFIYDNGLYMREPQYKKRMDSETIEFELVNYDNTVFPGEKAIVLRTKTEDHTMIAALTFHDILSADLYEEFHNSQVVSYIRRFASGKMVVITGIFQVTHSKFQNKQQDLLTESLSYFLKEEFTYALCHFNNMEAHNLEKTEVLFNRHGFTPVPIPVEGQYISLVDMRYPLILMHDIATLIKPPLRENQRVLTAIDLAHERIQLALTELYPQNLVLSFDSQYIQYRMLDLITAENHVPSQQQTPRILGEKMCVPFGNILRDMIVPNTVTKAMHTSKVYDPNASSYTIEESLNYSSIPSQIKTIKAFNRPAILVDDTLHKADRMQRIAPLLAQEEVSVAKVIVGVMSGNGKDIMDIAHTPVDSVYFIPNLRTWITESSLYPFIGGDTIRRNGKSFFGIRPSLNMILPYVATPFLRNISWQSLYSISLVSLTNAREIITVLEEEYQNVFERNLTLSRLSEVMYSPACPDLGVSIHYDTNQPPSVFIDNHIEQLYRNRNLSL
ncbi:MAG: hypothetical protein RSD55_03145 [Lachnospiraceae bacterium]